MSNKRNEPIAVIGTSCRFAGDVTSPSKLWDVLENPVDLRQEIPPSRFNVDGFYFPDGSYHGHMNIRGGYFIDQDLAAFDAEFFRVKPVEAKAIDPQQRFLLEVVYESLESAGLAISQLRSSDTGVYVGVMFNDYASMLMRDHQALPTYYATGAGQSILSNRISYFFDWHGASVTIDTACSSSLVAVHMAVQALRSGESRMALACGSNLMLGPEGFIIESKLNMLSPDGRSRMWDQGANGYARGDGVAAVVLKTLSAALEDGDHIECIIRETGLNQDGATPGITMPSARAQEALIRRTYANAGLDLSVPDDRPQFFEAHGTGTPAGDPIEAEAVHKAFFTSTTGEEFSDPLGLGAGHPLYVGSIKTVFGHTEGTAGVAALIKASLALRHSTVPPNLLFEQLSDRVAPFYKNVEILRSAKPWPQVDTGIKRASVNSFGFGGTNAHAIVESFDPPSSGMSPDGRPYTPFVFSASTEYSLRETLLSFLAFFERTGSDLNLQDLAWTLRQRRSALSCRTSFNASSIDELRQRIAARLEGKESQNIGIKSISTQAATGQSSRRILGVFTGQGAQYPRMGAELIEASSIARSVVRKLESYLAAIPNKNDRPSWSLETELLAGATSSRINEALLSQPLCTAVQILLVDLLKIAGVEFAAVIGHSSGEIAAAYAAGYLSAKDAMLIAYYRGLHSSLAASPGGSNIPGAMMAVGSSMEDMADLLSDELFAGRVTVAASNSSSSVTVSGDLDAIAELEEVLDDEEKFHRRLKVDKAYHSRHMLPCFEPYRAAIRNLGIESRSKEGSCIWFSSLHDGLPVTADIAQDLDNAYWPENMTKPVLFYQALDTALHAASYDLALEIGPHPALAGPARQTISEVLGKDLPYQGVLARGSSAIDASSDALGFIWSYLGSETVDLEKYERALGSVDDKHQFRLLRDLPTYRWNHDTKYWHEARSSRKMRTRSQPVHPLLGDITSDSAPHHKSWRNLLRASELDWLPDHAVQGQTVFPASGYLASAIEASRFIAEDIGSDIRLIALQDFDIHQAIPFEQDDAGIEVLIQMASIERNHRSSDDTIQAKFTYSAAIDASLDDLVLAASANVLIHLGEASLSLLPNRRAIVPHMLDVEPDRFYSALADLGYNFSGRFRSLSAIRRKRGKATCAIKLQPPQSLDHQSRPLLIHPSELDAVIQSAIVAYSYPYDEELRTVHLPTRIQQVLVNPTALLQRSSDTSGVNDLAAVDASISSGDGIVANISLYMSSTERSNAAIQVQGAAFMPLGGSAAEEDRSMYSQVQWILDRPDGTEASRGLWEGENQREIVRLLERIAIFYLRKFDRDVPQGHPARDVSPTKWYLNHARHVLEVVANGKQPWFEDEWQKDTLEIIQRASAPYSHLPDVEIMHLVGTQMPRVFEGETTMLQEFRAGGDDVLDRYYAEGIGLRELARWVGRAVKQLTDRHPHMSILEVGAGTGGATKAIFNEIGDSFVSYTYTDISAGFFEKASDVFAQQKTKMIFKTFDVEKGPLQQGYAEGTYDLIIAFFVIHATSDMEQSLRNMRKLLKPGGFLIVGEGSETGTGAATSGFIFGTLQGWWVGTEQGRVLSPLVSPEEWSRLLRVTGFSGPDAAPPISVEDIFNVFPIVSQAVDTHVNFLREPLSVHTPLQQTDIPSIDRLILIGGKSSRTKRLVEGLDVILRQGYATELHQFDTITDVDFELLDSDSAVISLADLDSPVFKDITPARFNALKKIVEPGKTVLWVTSGRLCDEPYANMTVAFGRVATHEMSDLRLQQFDVANPEHTTPETVAEAFLRFHAAHAKKDSQDTFWTIEPEIVVDEHGRQLVPRLRFIDELNDRYNAGRRDVARTTNLSTSANSISLQPRQDSGYQLRELSPYHFQVTAEDIDRALDLRITHSLLSALKTAFGHKFLVVGLDHETETSYLALVSSLASVVRVPRDCAVKFATTGMTASDVLAQVAAHLVSIEVMGSLHAGQAVVAHNIPRTIAAAMETQAAASHVQITFTTDRSDGSVPKSWIKLPSYIGSNDIDEILNLEEPPTVFVGLSNHTIAHSENETTLVSRFESWCNIVLTANSLFSPISTAKRHPNDAARAALGDRLRSAFAHVNQQPPLGDTEVLHLEDLVSGSPCIDPLCVVDWTCAASLPVLKSRLDIGQMFKSTGSTYWIVGMSGALGISLVDWMINKGARNVVMSSRRPDFSPEWIAAHKRKGALVTVVPCDVTDESAIKQAHRRICDTLPPIVGVVHGAMVLHDVSVRNMTFDQLQSVVRPKVDGAIYLDRIFENTNLDFFVFTSSINTVIGNLGQANYAAANAFMCSLAAQRRKRGFRAAAVNGGAIIGAGYMEREARRAWDKIAQHNYMMRLSEEDFVQSVCEGIDACRLESPYGPEISTGLNNVPFDARNQPFWAADPKFSIFIQHKQDVTDLGGQGKAAGAGGTTLLQNLEKCETQQQVYDTIKNAFSATLRAILQVSTSDEDLMSSRSGDIGLDSLVSVNVRSWFLKHLQVGIPVLKIMGNDTMGNLVRLAMETMPAELIPLLHASAGIEQDANTGSQGSPLDTNTSSSSTGTKGTTSPITSEDEEPEFKPYATKYLTDETGTDKVDWELESRPPADLFGIARATQQPWPKMPPEVIVLTGVSGLYGKHLLKYLLENTSARKIICLAIRNLPTRLKSAELPPPGPRVEYHEGNLSAPLLGLNPDMADAIFDEADAVIHNGADTSHMKGFFDLKASNVGSTVTLTRLCLPRRIPLHYVSSVGLAILYGQDAFPPVSIAGAALPATDGSFGYASCKWTCERLLERTHEHYGGEWLVCIHRPSTIMRQGEDAVGMKARLDWVHALLDYARKSRTVPRIRHNNGALDLVHPDNACADLVAPVVKPSERMARGEVGYVHQVGDMVLPLDRLQEIGVKEEGTAFKEVPMDDWVAKAVEGGMHPAVAALVEIMDEPGGHSYPKLLKELPAGQ